ASGMIGIDAGTGDVTGNGTVTALDASWMLQYAVGLRQFSAMQKQIGDVNLSSNGQNVNAFDAALTLAHVVGQVMLPFTGTLPVHLTGSTDPVPAKAVSLSPVSGKTGQIISIPVFVDANVAGIRSAQMKLVFDDSQLRVRSVSITELTKDFALASNIQNGSVAIAMANGNELTHGGQLLTIEAEIVGSGDNIVVSLEDIRLNDNSISSVTSVGTKDDNIPSTYELSQNYPNPFNPSTTIEYKLPQRAFVEMKIYDITGREVATLVSAMQEPGTYRVVWNATNGYGVKVASGVYFYRITAGNFTQLKKMLLLK
ncbi:MAG: T9SS type A sorting domain-containing protein, partial [Bacteroidota bacterium]|nr:T9SS type A sorting domain-containing protein [Bacteroidota bacterium]